MKRTAFLQKEDDYYFYLAIKSDMPKPLYIDMFFQVGDTVFNIHASSQLAQRILTDTTWTDGSPVSNWGKTNKWYANEVRFDGAKARELRNNGFEGNIYAETFIPYEGLEFQFDKTAWDFSNASFRVEVRNMIGPDAFADIIWPAGSERKNSQTWETLSWRTDKSSY